MDKKTMQRWMPLVVVAVLLAIMIMVQRYNNEISPTENPQKEATIRGLNRNPDELVYSKHARCRMGCRQIDETEVKDILTNGKINYAKSEIGDRPDCKRKYALEGTTKDGQRVRMIFAPCGNKVTVVTVIDIGRDWPCDCK